MKTVFTILFVILVFAEFTDLVAKDKLPPNAEKYLGVFRHGVPEYEYAGDKVEFQNFFGSLYMNYEGVENFGEHGAGHYFYANYVKPSSDGSLSFEIPARTLYSEPVRSGKFLAVRADEKKPIKLSGNIENGKLVLSCKSDGQLRTPNRHT